jgi:site-specific DNA-methyltransferase (adenine-specific)
MDVPYKLHNGDCREFQPEVFDIVVTDPPYGIGKLWNGEMKGKNGSSRLWGNGSNHWDFETFDNEYMLNLIKSPAIIWGGNFYPFYPVRGWLIWDKKQVFSGGDFEMAWTNLSIPPRVYRLSRIDGYFNRAETKKVHPTEKPLPLCLWVIENFTNEGDVIYDPFMGTGNFGVACKKLGRGYIGVEQKAEYFREAERRIKQAEQQPSLWHEAQQSVHLTASGAGGRGQNPLQSSFIADDPSAKIGGR